MTSKWNWTPLTSFICSPRWIIHPICRAWWWQWWRLLLRVSRCLQQRQESGYQEPEDGHHVSGSLPGWGQHDEEPAASPPGPPLRRRHPGAHLHCHRVHGERWVRRWCVPACAALLITTKRAGLKAKEKEKPGPWAVLLKAIVHTKRHFYRKSTCDHAGLLAVQVSSPENVSKPASLQHRLSSLPLRRWERDRMTSPQISCQADKASVDSFRIKHVDYYH